MKRRIKDRLHGPPPVFAALGFNFTGGDTNVTLKPLPPGISDRCFQISIVHPPLVEGVGGRYEMSRIHDPLLEGCAGVSVVFWGVFA